MSTTRSAVDSVLDVCQHQHRRIVLAVLEADKSHGQAVDNLRNSIVHNVLKFRTDPVILQSLHEGER